MAGLIAAASSVIMIKSSAMHPAFLSAYRLLLAAALFFPAFLRSRKRAIAAVSNSAGGAAAKELAIPPLAKRAAVPGLLLAAHFITWAMGARMTGSGNATMIISMVPAVMPFLALALLKERPTKGELLGTFIALGGVAFLGAFDYRLSAGNFAGDLVCFGSMVLFALYLVAGKRAGAGGGELMLFLLPLYLIAGAACLGFALFLAPPFAWSAHDWLMVLGLTLVPTMVGHTVFNWAMRRFPAQLCSLVNLTQFIFATVLALAFFGEAPEAQFYPAAALILAGQAIAVLGRRGGPTRRSGERRGRSPSSRP